MLKAGAGVGLTVTFIVIANPWHPFTTGVTVIFAVTGDKVGLTATKAGRLPVPESGRPICWSTVQLYTVAAAGPLNAGKVTVAFGHTVVSLIRFTPGVGCTVIVNRCGVLRQPEIGGPSFTPFIAT